MNFAVSRQSGARTGGASYVFFRHIARVAALTTWSSAALGHGGNADPAPWNACLEASIEDRCEFTDHHSNLHRGTCQSFDGRMMCVRNKPIVSAHALESTAEEFESKTGLHLFWSALLLISLLCSTTLAVLFIKAHKQKAIRDEIN